MTENERNEWREHRQQQKEQVWLGIISFPKVFSDFKKP
jgi:hypothetical protein